MIQRTSAFLISRLIFILSSRSFTIANNTLAFPDQINMLSIEDFSNFSGNCFISDSSNASKTTGFCGYDSFIFEQKRIGSISAILIITTIKSKSCLESIVNASAAVDDCQTRGALLKFMPIYSCKICSVNLPSSSSTNESYGLATSNIS